MSQVSQTMAGGWGQNPDLKFQNPAGSDPGSANRSQQVPATSPSQEAIWGHIGSSWGYHGPFWSHPVPSQGNLGAILGLLGASQGNLGAILGLLGAHLGAILGNLGATSKSPM
jgi:hypothetical protein